jgi:FtsH-binding integral membrane protein
MSESNKINEYYSIVKPSLSLVLALICYCIESVYALHGGCFIRGRNCLPFPCTLVHLLFTLWYGWDPSRVAHLFNFLCCVVFSVLFVDSFMCFMFAMYKSNARFVYRAFVSCIVHFSNRSCEALKYNIVSCFYLNDFCANWCD